MYCPNCAAPIDGVKFCRTCGANVSLVPQALTGRLGEPAEDDSSRSHRRGRSRQRRPATIESAVSSIFTGIGFLFVSLAVWRFFPGGFMWWFWLLIPALACIGEGVGKYLRLKSESAVAGAIAPPLIQTPAAPPELRAPTTSELAAPPDSIVEHTTRHLDPSK
jgi:hypothetical protein